MKAHPKYSFWYRALLFLRFYWRAKTKYRVHSPFVYQFVNAVLEDDRWFYAFTEWEILRRKLLKEKTEIQVRDAGAGAGLPARRSVAGIAATSANPPYICRWLFRAVQFLRPVKILELGTSLGISTGYLAAAARPATVITVEGCPQLAVLAKHHFQLLHVPNVQVVEGIFQQVLPNILKNNPTPDFIFFDGDHRGASLLQYVNTCMEFVHENTVWVFGDIYWSADMRNAWEEITRHPRITLSIDLFFLGFAFFRKENRVKEHFCLVPWSWKPWSVGFRDFLNFK